MTTEEAIEIIEFKLGRGKEAERFGLRNCGVSSWIGKISEEREALEMAISALSENKGEDRPQGHWIEKGYVGDGKYLFECSECHSTDTQSKTAKVNYCWNCGADMKGCKE